jgi:hypothetical protein
VSLIARLLAGLFAAVLFVVSDWIASGAIQKVYAPNETLVDHPCWSDVGHVRVGSVAPEAIAAPVSCRCLPSMFRHRIPFKTWSKHPTPSCY